MVRKGFLIVLMDPPPAFEDEFNAWYDTEHVPQRMAVPGILNAKRFVCVAGSPRYMAVYDLETPQVLDSEAYLSVSLDRSSPWTKRIASRVRVYRSAGVQVYPGAATSRRCARAVLLRFRAQDADAQPAIIAGLRANFDERPETIQVRVFAHRTDEGMDFLGLVEARAAPTDSLDPAPFAGCADALDLVNTYAPY